MRNATTLVAIATVVGDSSRCELHGQCEGLSQLVFDRDDNRLRLQIGAGTDYPTLDHVQQLVRSCPMDALTVVAAGETARCSDSQEP